ncbi:hypothetical protein AX14_012075 [Amanita brunnescens Koide BX004]|nr:hypothetical protein AX14_012075 [Amanita brunnescens Koide BX004]
MIRSNITNKTIQIAQQCKFHCGRRIDTSTYTMSQLFGATCAATYIDILWIDDEGSQLVLRANKEDVTRLLTAVAMMTGPLRLSVIRQSAFLPALLSARDVGQDL